ncbi:DUF4232 domain-containing protein [Streptomyces tailanensis]|uniref:DUF4232 domain-containing protein n=1 Tax=Streptomyces tailanensis TaxID=2569858 RepID=UPI00122E6F82|nr:DUF4232 domain-containing protein [Streptomyces tailanensis]
MRTFRTARTVRVGRPDRLLAATGVALAALALTACDNGMGTRDEGAPGGSTSTSQTTGTSGTTADGTSGTTADGSTGSTTGGSTTDNASSTTGTGTGTDADKTSANGGTDDPADPASRVTCNGSNTTVTVQPVSRPLNHMLITVKNTGSKFCDLYYNPSVRFGEAQSAPRVIEDSQPQAVVTLAPGESGYAGVLLSSADGSGENGTTAHKLTVGFQGLEPGSNGGPSALPSLPAEGVYYDSTLAVTYWQSSMDDALSY